MSIPYPLGLSLQLLRTYPCGAHRSAAAAALLAHALRTRPCSQMPLPPHSLHTLRCRPCARNLQREAAAAAFFASHTVPHHVLASDAAVPPHSLQSLRRLPCSQMLLPPHSLHERW